MTKLMKKALKQTSGKNGRPELPVILTPGVVVVFCADANVDGLVDVMGFAFIVSDADERMN
jgi:hypothetical protein